jgi:hypothetical protein
MLLLLSFSFLKIFREADSREEWTIITILIFVVIWLAFMLRQHYALTNQNRIVRLEMRLRYYQLTQQDFELLESQLSFGQIAALRFSPDQELLPLIKRAIEEKLSPNDIKKSIINWKPDNMRV